MVLYELGVRIHRIIYDHLQLFNYSSAGVMAVICDVQVIVAQSPHPFDIFCYSNF